MRSSSADRVLRLLTWPAALFIAGVLLWYEQYKLTGHPGSTSLFTTLTDWLGFSGHEKAMRLGVATCEIITSVLVLVPATRLLGALGAVTLMTGAIFFHIVSPLGIDPYGDGAVLFTRACETLACAVFIVFTLWAELPALAARVPVAGPALGRMLGGAARRQSFTS
jgi:hypothetical protein